MTDSLELAYSIKSEEYTSNVNSIFFKKRFDKDLKLSQKCQKITAESIMDIHLMPIQNRYIMPISLYHFTLGCTIHLS